MNLLRRLQAATRFVVAPKARYEGARHSTQRSTLHGSVQSASFDIDPYSRYELVRRSRYFERNNAFVNRIADLFEQYTVGQGLAFFPSSSDAAWNASALSYWRDWQRFADLSSRLSFGSLQGIVARALFVDGEIFIVLTRGDSGKPRIQLVESHRVKNPPTQDGRTIIDGIEVDDRGRPTAYWITNEDAKRKETFQRVEAQFVVHVFEPGRPGQYRGLPALYPVMNDLHDLDDLQIFEMQAAKAASKVQNVIKTKEGEVTDDDIIRGTVTGSDGVERADYYKDVFGGEVAVLKHGDEFNQFQVERPSAATSGFRITTPTTEAPGASVRGPGAASISRPVPSSTALHADDADTADAFFAPPPPEEENSGSPSTTILLTATPDLPPGDAPLQLAALAGEASGPAAALFVSSPLAASKQTLRELNAPRAKANEAPSSR